MNSDKMMMNLPFRMHIARLSIGVLVGIALLLGGRRLVLDRSPTPEPTDEQATSEVHQVGAVGAKVRPRVDLQGENQIAAYPETREPAAVAPNHPRSMSFLDTLPGNWKLERVEFLQDKSLGNQTIERSALLRVQNFKYPLLNLRQIVKTDESGKKIPTQTVLTVADHVMVQLVKNSTREDLEKVLMNHHYKIRSEKKLTKVYLIQFEPVDPQTIDQVIEKLKKEPIIERVARDTIHSI